MRFFIKYWLILSLFMPEKNLILASGKENPLKLDWEVGFHKEKEQIPDSWLPAVVPGAVQLDYARAHQWGPYWYADNWKDYGWMEDVYWTYRAFFDKPVFGEEERVIFYSKGIDYEFDIDLNGQKLHYQEGMFTPVEIDITGYLQEQNELIIDIYPAPKANLERRDRSQADRSVKPAVSYGWDWHPRLIPCGIWDETGIQVMSRKRLGDWSVDYHLNKNFTRADVTLNLSGREIDGMNYEVVVRNQVDVEILKKTETINNNRESVRFEIPDVSLWWPWDQGEPYLYEVEVHLLDEKEMVQLVQRRVGFRSVRLVMNPGTWQVDGFPKSRSNPPMTLEINGRRLFCRGTNWVNPEIFPGIISRQTYDTLTDLALTANFNLLRIWGGAIVNKDSFFELCDEKGILVWQDFPLACNPYEGTPEYLAVLEQEGTSIIHRLKEHPSLVLWCGGNELYNNWSGMTDQSLALRLLNSLTFRLDPSRPFIPTSPIMGVGHGNYVFRDMQTGEEVFQWMPRAHNTAYTEFGMPGPSPVEILESFIPPDQLFPPRPGTVWETHHAFNAWVGNTWLCEDMLELYFGPSADLESLVGRGQLVQSQGYKVIYEEARRQRPYCSMALNWCFNEPWPTAANNSLINWPALPKPAFDAVRESCRPVLASGRVKKFLWKKDEEFTVDLYLLNDSPEKIPPGKMIVRLIGDDEIELLQWDFPEVPANRNLAGPTVRIGMPDWRCEMFDLVLEISGESRMNSSYSFLYKPTGQEGNIQTPELNK
jgi:beta-mannosidase